ncbi:MAG: sodium:glutamate symporter [Kiritimatiellae bacterium]|nr:sodium:glutamate symporter [Kiritimatiellia bacterium]
MDAVATFTVLSLLLFAGKVLRVRLPFLQRLYLPSSVIGGLCGLAAFCALGDLVPAGIVSGMRAVPSFLINVIFAALFLGAAVPKLRDVVRLAFPQLCLGQIVAWGQYVVGLGLAGFFFTRWCGVPAVFGNLLEIGFEGGHGTVGGMAESFRAFGWEEGVALGYTVATVGMIAGIVVGMALVQWAHRRGYVKSVRTFGERSRNERIGVHEKDGRPSAGLQTVICDSVDSLAWHVAVVGVACLVGVGLHRLIPVKGFPLFPLCMIGGVALQTLAGRLKIDLLVDRVQMERISGAALDFLVVAAVATIRLDVVAAHGLPLAVLLAAGMLWSAGAVLFVAPRIFRDAWFERAIAEFGQATGVTATGLLLLRTVDPETRTPAAMSFGCKQLLHEPFMGGGMWTALALALVYRLGWLPVFLFSLAMLAFWCVCAWVVRHRSKS